MKHRSRGFLRTDMIRYAPGTGGRWHNKAIVAACILVEVLGLTVFVTGVVVVFSLFERV